MKSAFSTSTGPTGKDGTSSLGKVNDVEHMRLSIRSPLLRFRINGVEARLFQPLRVDNSEQATSYFQHFEVVANDESEARRLLVAELTNDEASFQGWQSIDLEAVGDPGPPRIVTKSGRVFFNDG